MKSKKTILILMIVALITIAITTIFYNQYKIVKTQTINVDFEIGEDIGFNIDTDALHFGRIPTGSSSTRKLNMTNNYNFDIKVNFKPSEELDGVVIARENNKILSPGEIHLFWIDAKAPQNPEKQYYNGTLKITFLRS